MKTTLPNNTPITFKFDETSIIKGTIKGISSAEMPVIGRSYIVEVNPSEYVFFDYPYSCLVVFECAILTANGVAYNQEQGLPMI